MSGYLDSLEPPPWLRYSNQGATRNDPISPVLVEAMSFLPEMGITMEVFSGGQEAANEPGAQRTGSTRHDHGNAADVKFYRNGRLLDWANPDDLPIFQEIVRKGRERGLTGIGAGDGYMQPASMHIGFGSEAVWGAGGSGANAPEWLRSAFYGAQAGSVPPKAASNSPPLPTSPPPATDNRPRLSAFAVMPRAQVHRIAMAYRNGQMTPEDAALYQRGVAEGVFPAVKGPDFADAYFAHRNRSR